MNKKAIMTEVVVRSVIAVIAIVTVAIILTKCYNQVAYSDAEKRFEKLTETINTLQDGEKKQVAVTLDTGGALLGFTKQSAAITFFGFNTRVERPANCLKDNACICLCDKFEFSEVNDLKYLCTGRLQCKKLSLDLPATYTSNEFFPTPKGSGVYSILTNGFIIDRADSLIPSPGGRLFTLSLTRKGDKLEICETSVCPVQS